MYNYKWDVETHGFQLTTQTGKFVANEIRPVFAEELSLIGLNNRFEFDINERHPLMWAQKNVYYADGEKVAQLNGTQYGSLLYPEFFFEGVLPLKPVDTVNMVAKNSGIMDIVVADAKRRVKELYDKDLGKCDIAYIAFSGGKDSVALLDICNRVLPLSVPVIFSDTDMELPDTYTMWEEIQKCYPEREFLRAKAETSALENWRRFGPPSRTVRWCCSVHKSAPALVLLKHKLDKTALKAMAFVGVRREESYSRSFYEDSGAGVKNASQINQMPILDWGAHELFLYTFANELLINRAYRYGLARVGCVMCPESSDKYEWYVDAVYPSLVKPFRDIIIDTSVKSFRSENDKTEFIGSSSWQARKSGIALCETLTKPLETEKGLNVSWQSPHFNRLLFFEWIKTIGKVETEREGNQHYLRLTDELGAGVPFTYIAPYTGGGEIEFEFPDLLTKSFLSPLIRSLLRKVSACVGCLSCEAECPTGALITTRNGIHVDSEKCIHCNKCFAPDYGCWRFKSMLKSETAQSGMSGINRYNNFGLRENWLPTLIQRGANFFVWSDDHPLGKKMVESASAWFRQSLLVNSHRMPTSLVELFSIYGSAYQRGWDFIWLALANNAVLVKWFITATQVDVQYSTDMLLSLLGETNPELGQSTKDGGLAALKDMITKSPFGGEGAVTSVEMKGRTVKSIVRHAKEADPLAVLYGLYIIASKDNRSGFTVRELMTADSESSYISPLTAFGIEPETFKRQCQGLQSRYPDFISCTFTHGLDEVTVFPEKHTTEAIIHLALGE